MWVVVEMLRAPELVCRAWDDNMNTQPDSFTWNLMCACPYTCAFALMSL